MHICTPTGLPRPNKVTNDNKSLKSPGGSRKDLQLARIPMRFSPKKGCSWNVLACANEVVNQRAEHRGQPPANLQAKGVHRSDTCPSLALPTDLVQRAPPPIQPDSSAPSHPSSPFEDDLAGSLPSSLQLTQALHFIYSS